MKKNQLGHISFADFDTLSVSSVCSESSPEQGLASNDLDGVNDSVSMEPINMRDCSIQSKTSKRTMSPEPVKVRYTSSEEDDSATMFSEKMKKQDDQSAKKVVIQKTNDEPNSVSVMHSSVFVKSGNVNETMVTKHAQTTSSTSSTRSRQLSQRSPRTMTDCKANMREISEPEEKADASTYNIGKTVNFKLSVERQIDLDSNLAPEDNASVSADALSESNLQMDYNEGYDYYKGGSDFEMNSNADGDNYNDDFMNVNMVSKLYYFVL